MRRSIQAFEAAGRGFEPLRAHHLLPRPATSVVEPAPRLPPWIGAAVLSDYLPNGGSNPTMPFTMAVSAQPGFSAELSTAKIWCPYDASSGM